MWSYTAYIYPEGKYWHGSFREKRAFWVCIWDGIWYFLIMMNNSSATDTYPYAALRAAALADLPTTYKEWLQWVEKDRGLKDPTLTRWVEGAIVWGAYPYAPHPRGGVVAREHVVFAVYIPYEGWRVVGLPEWQARDVLVACGLGLAVLKATLNRW